MKKTFFPAHLIGTVSAPASKSEAHRRMICAGLTQGETMLTGFMDSADMAATMRCLGALGSTFNRDGDTLTISGMQGKIAKMPVMDCGESGSTLRFFVPIALTVAGGTVFLPNDLYPLEKETFRLYYTSASTDQQTIDIYIIDSFGQMQQLTLSFNNDNSEEGTETITP